MVFIFKLSIKKLAHKVSKCLVVLPPLIPSVAVGIDLQHQLLCQLTNASLSFCRGVVT